MPTPTITNGIWNATASGTATLVGVFGSVLIVRGLSPREYGEFSYYLWLATAVGILGTLGFPVAITKVTSELRGRDRELQADALSRRVTLLLVSVNGLIGLALLGLAVLLPERSAIYLIVIAAVVPFNALAAVLRSTLWGRDRYVTVSVAAVLASVMQLALIAVVHVVRPSAPAYAAAVMSASVSGAIVLLALAQLRTGAQPRTSVGLEPGVVRGYLSFAAPATLVLLVEVAIWQRSGIFFLERMSDLAEVGFYNLSFTLFGMLLVLGSALLHGFYPAISRDFGAGDWTQIRGKVRQGLLLAAVFSVPLTFGGWATIDPVVRLLYGEKMAPAVPVAQVLLLGLFPGAVTAMIGLTTKSLGGIWMQVRLGLLAAAAFIVLNLALVPQWSALGAAAANTTTQVLYAGLLAVAVRRRYQLPFPYRAMAAVVVIGAATTFALPLMMQATLRGAYGVLLAIPAGAIVYSAVIWHLRRSGVLLVSTPRIVPHAVDPPTSAPPVTHHGDVCRSDLGRHVDPHP